MAIKAKTHVIWRKSIMKKTTSALLLFFAMLFMAIQSNAQTTTGAADGHDYQTAVGLKFGPYEIGPSVKYFFQGGDAIEGVLGFRSHGVVITGLWERHVPIFNVDQLKFFYGGGGHFGPMTSGYHDGSYYADRTVKLGVDGVIGLEYLVPNTPIAISVDVDPRVEFVTGSTFDIAPALGLKYAF